MAEMYSKGEQMQKPEFISQLIDKASAVAGNDSKLAGLLEVSRGNVADWRAGRRACPVADVVLMAELAGLPADEWAARAVVAQYEGTSKGDKLFRALGKTLPAIGAAVVSSGASAHQIFSAKGGVIETAVSYFVRCIEVLSLFGSSNSNRRFITR